ncbi:hypothetical protein C8A00DRAFT_46966 [Chaetomidium leptoderma]|uniref:Uncharacterized protein n=1 Tax=Chaetomidium leptoderma TaxID=669021 RepID=A0AAN6VF70_9PEZI|nr:hypothetical protein C8A00DRAFT_46966 [Chaetomidium leptoderma]
MDVSGQNMGSTARPAQRPLAAQRPAQTQARESRPAQKVATRPGGKPVQVIETKAKKTVWGRVKNGASKAAKPSSWKNPGKAAKRLMPSSTHAKDNYGLNTSYYRKTFFLLDKQAQFDLYMAGMAPKLTKLEANRLGSFGRPVTREYKRAPVLYVAQVSPSGYSAPLRNIVVEAKAAKVRAAAAAKKKKEAAAAAAGNPDALPAFPTPAAYSKIQIQTRPAKAQQQQRQRQQQQQRLSQAQTQRRPQPRSPQRHSQQIGMAISHPPHPPHNQQQQQQRQQYQYYPSAPATSQGQRQPGRRVVGYSSVAGSSRV